jgi:carbamoyltransferase
LGVALFICHQLLDRPRVPDPQDSQRGSLLGPSYGEQEIRRMLDGLGAVYRLFDRDEALCAYVSDLLVGEKVVGWFCGRMEFGPRALGSRSILGDARSERMQSVMNLKIKFRESFRPFAPSVLQERVDRYFEMRNGEASPYMLLVAPVRSSRRLAPGVDAVNVTGLDALRRKRSDVPAITHVDYSARVQTVDTHRHGRYYGLLRAFEEKSGCPLVVNTSFNVRGEPIVCTPKDAYECFMATNMDALVLERLVLLKNQQPNACQHDVDEYLARFDLD